MQETNRESYSIAARLSIVWAVTLSILTIIEWRQLDRDPLEREILSPFIERQITVHVGQSAYTADEFKKSTASSPEQADKARFEVEFHFNGPLFLLCFFAPVAAFHGVSGLLHRWRKN